MGSEHKHEIRVRGVGYLNDIAIVLGRGETEAVEQANRVAIFALPILRRVVHVLVRCGEERQEQDLGGGGVTIKSQVMLNIEGVVFY